MQNEERQKKDKSTVCSANEQTDWEKMWLMLCWLVGLPKLICHFLLTLPLIILYLFCKIFGTSTETSSTCLAAELAPPKRRPLLDSLQQRQQEFADRIRDKMRLVMRRESEALSRWPCNQARACNDGCKRGRGCGCGCGCGYVSSGGSGDSRSYYLASVLLVGLLCLSNWPTGSYCLEQDAEILKPVAGLAKSVIKTVTLGEPLEVNFEPSGLVKNFAYFTWRTGFPVSMPRGFMQKVQDFYNRVKFRVDEADVKDVERKSLASLKLDLDEIVDSIVEEVRKSPDGLYTDYLRTRVRGIPLEDACTRVGIQLKAYGVDLTNYRNIAGMVLGIPVMPTVASTMLNVANLASLDAMRNLTQTFGPLNNTALFLAKLPGNAFQSVSTVSSSALNSIGSSLSQQLPVKNLVQATAPLNLFRQQPALA